MTAADLGAYLESRFGAIVGEAGGEEGMPSLQIASDQAIAALDFLRKDRELGFDLLVDLTAVDFLHAKGRTDSEAARFHLIYQLYSTSRRSRLRLAVPLPDEAPEPDTATGIWPAAGWFEREVHDLFGIRFRGQPNIDRLLLPGDFLHWPLRKDYPLQGLGERELLSRGVAGGEDSGPAELAAWFASHPHGEDGGVEEEEAQTAFLEWGLQHPGGRGDLRFALELEGERILRARPDPGYLHAGLEKLGEHRSFQQLVPIAERLNPFSPFCCGLAFALSAEELLQLEVPQKGRHIRIVLAELTRIGAHLAWLAEQARAAGGETASLRAAGLREQLGELLSALTGSRTAAGFLRIGGVRGELLPAGMEAVTVFLTELRRGIDAIHLTLTDSGIWRERVRGVGGITAAGAIAGGASGPVLRGAGVACDARRDTPYAGYEEFDFEVVVGTAGDVYDRYLVRMEELVQSGGIVSQAIEGMPEGDCALEDARLFPPAKERVQMDMESLIHHFELWMDGHGLRPPVGGEACVPTEAPGGECSFCLFSDGTDKPYRMRVRTPSFAHFQLFPQLLKGARLADVGTILESLNIVASEVDR